MTQVIVPDGDVIQVGPAASGVDLLTTNRDTRYRFDILDGTGRKFGDLDGVSSGTVSWNANSQVKGGGKIVVSKANKIHDQDIRVSTNYPVLDQRNFETDTGEFNGNGEFSDRREGPKSVTRDTGTFYEGGAALDIEYGPQDSQYTEQNTVALFDGLIPGEAYTFVTRVLNASASAAIAKIAFHYEFVPLPQASDWQTVALTFVANSDLIWFGVNNLEPVDGDHIYLDSVVLYEGVTEGYNGETFEYAPFSWLHARVRPVLIVEGVPEVPLGVFVPAAPVEQWSEGGGRQEVELLDRTSVLRQDYLPASYTAKAGTNVISAVRKLIASTGERVGALTTSDDTLPSDLFWGAGTNKLTVVNELLAAAGYLALWADGNGQFRAEGYHSPKARPVAYSLLDGDGSIYLPNLSIDRDLYDIPNRVIMTAQGSGQSEPWTAIATNRNKDSPFSYDRRGRWITDVLLGVEAISLQGLEAKAEARLSALTATQATIQVQHAPVPGLRVNEVVRLRRDPADVDTLFTVTKTSINFNPTALAKSTLTEVVDL